MNLTLVMYNRDTILYYTIMSVASCYQPSEVTSCSWTVDIDTPLIGVWDHLVLSSLSRAGDTMVILVSTPLYI